MIQKRFPVNFRIIEFATPYKPDRVWGRIAYVRYIYDSYDYKKGDVFDQSLFDWLSARNTETVWRCNQLVFEAEGLFYPRKNHLTSVDKKEVIIMLNPNILASGDEIVDSEFCPDERVVQYKIMARINFSPLLDPKYHSLLYDVIDLTIPVNQLNFLIKTTDFNIDKLSSGVIA